MTRYILMDNHSGFIFGDVEAENVIDACRIVDEQEVKVFNREYYVQPTAWASFTSGYFVYQADKEFPPITDGQDRNQIEAVSSLPYYRYVETRNEAE